MGSAHATLAVAREAEGSLLDHIGNTPLLHLGRISAPFRGVEIRAKAEFLNPGGSVKDRAGLSMILDGEREGAPHPGKIILDASSGNTGIAYAMVGAAKGYRTRICIPGNASSERLRTLVAYGAELVRTDPAEGSDGAIERCREIYRSNPSLYFYPDQYNNPANWRAHFLTTAPEIRRQTRGRITHFVAALGTSGTFTGVTRRLKQDLPHVQCIAVQPRGGFHGIEGAKMTRRLAREEGLLVGVSAGANVAAAVRLADELASSGRRGVIVTILCDGGQRYLSEGFWNAAD